MAVTNLTDTAITGLILTNSFTTEAGAIDELLSWTDGSPALKPEIPADAEVLNSLAAREQAKSSTIRSSLTWAH